MNIQMTLAARYLGGRKLRTVLTTLAIVFGVVVIFGLNMLLPSFGQALQSNLMAVAGQVDTTITLKTSDSFDAVNVEKAASVEGVSSVSGYLNRAINIPENYFAGSSGVEASVNALTLLGVNPEQAAAMHVYLIQEGSFLSKNDVNAVVISESLSETLGLKLGDNLRLPGVSGEVELKIIGILPPRMAPGNEEIYLTLQDAQSIFNLPGQVNTIEINFDSLDEERRLEVEKNILAVLGDSFQSGALEANSELLANMQMGQVVLNVLGVLSLLMGGFIIFNTFRTLVAERRRDIGMLRALGATRSMVSRVILLEGLAQGIIGTVLGVILGYLLAYGMTKLIDPVVKEFFNVSIGAPVFSVWLLLVSAAMGIGITLLAGWLPARSASRITPLEALRPTLGRITLKQIAGPAFWSGAVMIALALAALLTEKAAFLGLGGALFIVGLVLIAPTLVNPIANLFGSLLALVFARSGTAHLARGNITRQPGRTVVTASTTMIGMAILVMAAAMISSMMLGFENILRKNLGSDYLLVPPSVGLWGSNVGANASLDDELSQIEGVGLVSSLRYAPSQVNGIPFSLVSIDPVNYPQVSGLDFTEGDEDEAYAALAEGRNIIVNGILAMSAGIGVGDEIELVTPTGTQSYRVVALGGDMLNVKISTGYISHAKLEADFQHTEATFIQINLAPQADEQAVEQALKNVVKKYPQFTLFKGKAYVDQMLELFNAAFAGIVALVIFLAVPSLIAMVNTLAIGVIERTREIGMLRAVGATRKQVSTIILIEALILSALGTILGLLVGLYLGYMAVTTLKGLGFPMEFAFPSSGVILVICVGVLLGLVAAIIPSRQASRLQIVEALRYE